MMVKNEHKRLGVTLESVKDIANSIVLYDTGSTDDTISIATSFCTKNKIPLRLKQGEFVDFSTSRNISLDFANTFEDIDYILLLDTNDELRGDELLKKICLEFYNKPNTGFLVCQEWWSGQYDQYYNMRLIKPRKGWRYKGKVHEWLSNTNYSNDEEAIACGDTIVKLENVVLYQDRTQDDDKSGKRYDRDKILLLQEHKENPTEPRTVFYLAQTFSCLGELEDAFYYYKLRTTLVGFWEERFHSFYRCGEISESLGHPWEESMKWYIKSFEHTERVEPLIKISEYYKDKNWLLSFTFADLACKLPYPSHCNLFIDKHAYDYKRWHMLGLSGWYTGFYEQGKIGCIKGVESGVNIKLDKENLKHYEELEKSKKIENIKTKSRKNKGK